MGCTRVLPRPDRWAIEDYHEQRCNASIPTLLVWRRSCPSESSHTISLHLDLHQTAINRSQFHFYYGERFFEDEMKRFDEIICLSSVALAIKSNHVTRECNIERCPVQCFITGDPNHYCYAQGSVLNNRNYATTTTVKEICRCS